jgi:hypothetical protein
MEPELPSKEKIIATFGSFIINFINKEELKQLGYSDSEKLRTNIIENVDNEMLEQALFHLKSLFVDHAKTLWPQYNNPSTTETLACKKAALAFAARLDLTDIVAEILHSSDISSIDLGVALCEACYSGNMKTAEFILKRGKAYIHPYYKSEALRSIIGSDMQTYHQICKYLCSECDDLPNIDILCAYITCVERGKTHRDIKEFLKNIVIKRNLSSVMLNAETFILNYEQHVEQIRKVVGGMRQKRCAHWPDDKIQAIKVIGLLNAEFNEMSTGNLYCVQYQMDVTKVQSFNETNSDRAPEQVPPGKKLKTLTLQKK